jgi:hypothetical protein
MREIPLSYGLVGRVSEEDYDRVSRFKWRAVKVGQRWYAIRRPRVPGNIEKRKTVLLHRFIMGDCPEGKEIDHKDRDGLNNTRENLRFATRSQNNVNRDKRPSRCGFIGVFPSDNRHLVRFCAKITEKKKQIYLGRFETAQVAALAYDARALLMHGEFATLNFTPMGAPIG